jgi:hypothetical protein
MGQTLVATPGVSALLAAFLLIRFAWLAEQRCTGWHGSLPQSGRAAGLSGTASRGKQAKAGLDCILGLICKGDRLSVPAIQAKGGRMDGHPSCQGGRVGVILNRA